MKYRNHNLILLAKNINFATADITTDENRLSLMKFIEYLTLNTVYTLHLKG